MITRSAFPTIASPRILAPVIVHVVLPAMLVGLPCQSLEGRDLRRKVDERAVAACIARSAAGRGWLEKTLWALRDQEGGWVGAEIENRDGSHDLGPLQVNSWWVPRLAAATARPEAQIRFWLKQDACFNVEAARWIFLSGLAASGDFWTAVGIYHSPKGWRQRRYTTSVVSHLRQRFGPQVFESVSKPSVPRTTGTAE